MLSNDAQQNVKDKFILNCNFVEHSTILFLIGIASHYYIKCRHCQLSSFEEGGGGGHFWYYFAKDEMTILLNENQSEKRINLFLKHNVK